MLMRSDDTGATVSLMPEGALLLAGDAIEIDIFVGPGARLELLEPAGTVAYAMNGACASWNVTVELAAASTLVWAGEPFVVAEGASVRRNTTIRLDAGASMAWRETLVLGRHGERPGSLRQEVAVSGHRDVPVLHEELALGLDTSPLLLGGARAIGSVLVLGHRLPADLVLGTGARYELEAEGTLVRQLSSEAHLAMLGDVWSAARRRMAVR